MRNDNSCIKIGEKYLYQVFHENTVLSLENSGGFESSIINFYENEVEAKNQGIACYSNKSFIEISVDKEFDNNGFLEIFDNRRSSRSFCNNEVSQKDFLYILRCAIGGKSQQFPNYPISGGIECFTIIVIVKNVEDIESGIYIYDRKEERLLFLTNEFKALDYHKVTLSYNLAQNAAFSVHILSDSNAKCLKYQDRGYRFLLLEAGHLAQNFYLIANLLSIGVVSSGGYLDHGFSNLIPNYKEFAKLDLLYELFFGVLEDVIKN
ncbi:SagB/ThcOx family dehydrogenase [Streptococcus sanguinis]|uniref:SagB/ThcOx family dehydrogenase n=1 Tax=Streptococcus sanguinis TaxID=1305 RepID=UPI000F68AA27|nr:SagB/ThcOx family dehydrogenase [Streptococcus sanguinis]RSI51723.1 Nitroreductase family protein [Streptococcus sanguinis]